MAKQEKYYSYALIAIVAIVAIVGIVVMMLNVQPKLGISTSTEQESLLGAAAATVCADSDGGKNYNLQGTATKGTSKVTDYCLTDGKRVVEYYCSNNKINSVSYDCSKVGKVCRNGACEKLPVCGNGIIEAGEECDSSNLNGQTCISKGYAGGTLKCSSTCKFNTTGCYPLPNLCGNGIIEAGEECDDGNLNYGDGCDQYCNLEGSWCNDTDGGKNYYLKGTVHWGPINEKYFDATDSCDSAGETLLENYCESGDHMDTFYICPYGCNNGACLNKVLQITNLGSVTNPNVGGRLDYGNISKIREFAQQGKKFKVKAVISHYPSNAKYALLGEPNIEFDCATYTYAPATGTPYGGWITCTKQRQVVYSNYSAYTEADLWFMIPIASSYNGNVVVASTKLYRNATYLLDDSLFVNYAEVYTY
jgi:cysteine-rich repeat protein